MKHHQESSVLVYISLCHVVYVLYSHASFYHTNYIIIYYILHIIYYILYIIYYILYIIYTYWIDYNRFNVYLFFWLRQSQLAAGPPLHPNCSQADQRIAIAAQSSIESIWFKLLQRSHRSLQHIATYCNMLQHLNHIIYDIWLYDYICD
jgi:hypothetical protein